MGDPFSLPLRSLSIQRCHTQYSRKLPPTQNGFTGIRSGCFVKGFAIYRAPVELWTAKPPFA
jgi:hypothetical protein